MKTLFEYFVPFLTLYFFQQEKEYKEGFKEHLIKKIKTEDFS